MNEKSKQEAEESADKWIKWAIDHKALTYWNSFVEGYLASAKPREKRIANLEAQIEKMKCCENCRYCNKWGEANSNSPNCEKCNWVSNWKLRR